MKQELLRVIKMPLYWLIIGTGTITRVVFAYLDRLHRAGQFWSLCADFWTKIGALTMVVLILVCLIRLFAIDRECRTEGIITSASFGRQQLFWRRLFAIIAGAVIGVLVLAFTNIFISATLGGGLIANSTWMVDFLTSTAIALCGCAGLSVVAGAVCDISKSQPVTLCICGVPFIVSLFVNSSILKPWELFWFIRFGFFSELMRGRALESLPGVWVVWYGIMLIATVALAIHKRKERKEL